MTGVIFFIVGIMATTVDMRLAVGGIVFGVLSIIIGFASKSTKDAPPVFIPQPPQQVVRTLVICPKCGNRVSADVKFCPECGANLMPGKPQPA